MDIRKEIESYLNCKEATGALLLTGEWGCGKSYLIKEIAKEFSEKKNCRCSNIFVWNYRG